MRLNHGHDQIGHSSVGLSLEPILATVQARQPSARWQTQVRSQQDQRFRSKREVTNRWFWKRSSPAPSPALTRKRSLPLRRCIVTLVNGSVTV
jgi:hypothetical protein